MFDGDYFSAVLLEVRFTLLRLILIIIKCKNVKIVDIFLCNISYYI
ncbi:hypothetical protein HMPREF0868_0594 [Mageeibacillus indolicus UPII9-5]|uniref:Uncharacterized protein n=1 Tax=Mageeibacillus indolicus (strain UPII9-5) TaxID=699246 RepID=D3R160_MAGIU|nr:hypothetical protein HMPREF0868_0594 [Mageeibacillus indolicus UPII9-5]